VFFVTLYSHIVILGISALLAGDLLPTYWRTTCSLAPPVLQAVLPVEESPSVAPSRRLSSRQQASELSRSKPSGTVSRAASVAISDPPFLRQPIQFGPNSVDLTVAGRNMLKRAAAWLRQHREARILIVGSCDAGGSETCTRALAEARGAVVRKFLGSSGIASGQIVGVKGWNNLDQSCRSSDIECHRVNRSAQIFAASSVAP
jgi:outer membrane protein OmpA-like peptidoglycan-associated protein